MKGRWHPRIHSRKLSREEGRPVFAGHARWSRQRWFRFSHWPGLRAGSGALGRFYYMARYDVPKEIKR